MNTQNQIGLTSEEAAKRAEAGQSNRRTTDPGKSVLQILSSNLFTLFNGLNFLLALALLAVGSYRNMMFLGVVVSNTLIKTIQELRARKTISRLELLHRKNCTVIRDGAEKQIDPEELVLGDVVVLHRGDQIPADGVVLDGSGAVDESLLTGESEPIQHAAGDRALSGTFITEGRLLVTLDKVGDDSYAAQLTREGRTIHSPHSQLMKDLNGLLRIVSAILLPLGLLVLLKQTLLNHTPLKDAVPSAVASMLGMIPEGLILLTSVALLVGVIRLGTKNVLVQELYGIETLARARVLCLDKTGTLTTGRMLVDRAVPVDADEETIRRELARFLGAFDAEAGTLSALRDWCEPQQDSVISVDPFSSKKKSSAAVFSDGVTVTLGAPGFVPYPPSVQPQLDKMTGTGLRVLVLSRTGKTGAAECLGLLALQDELRPGCRDTLEEFRKEGVILKLISGDDPRTVSAIAARLGLEGAWVDASKVTDEELAARCMETTVFGRVSPEQKRLLVNELKKHGMHVAMTGDGVNDIAALKTADCSIAVAGGSDAARHAAQISIPGDGFPLLPDVVGEGRRVVGNITRAASLFLVKTLSTFFISLAVLFLPLAYPFQPVQLTLVSALTLGIPSFFLALEPNRERIRGHFLKTILFNALPGALGVAVSALLCMTGVNAGLPSDACSVLAALCALLIGLLVLYRVCVPLTKLRIAVAGGMTAASVIAVCVLGSFFRIDLSLLTGAAVRHGLMCVAAGAAVWLVAGLVMKKLQRPENE